METNSILLQTSLGEIAIKFNNPENMFIENKNQHFVVRNIKYRFSLHLGFYEESWSLYRNQYGRPERYHLNVTRTDIENWKKHDGSEAVRNKIYDVVVEKINEWTKTDEYKKVIAQLVLQRAEQAKDSVMCTIERLKREMEEAQGKLFKLHEDIVTAKHNLKLLFEGK